MSNPIDERALRAKLLSGARWSVMFRISGQLYSWLITLFMVRLLTPTDYGLNSMLEVPLEVLTLFTTLGIDGALIRFGRKDERQLASAFGFLMLANGLIFAVLFLAAPWIAAYFKEPQLTDLVRVAAIAFVLTPFRTIPNALLDMDLDFRLKAKVEFASTVVASLMGLALAFYGAGVWALVAVTLVNAVLRALALAWLRPWFVRPRLEFVQIKPLIAYGTTMLLGSFILIASGKVTAVVGGPVLGTELLGLWAVAAFFANLPFSKVMPIVQQTLLPAFAKLTGAPELIKKYVLHSVELCTLIIVPVGLGVACVANDFVAAFLGEHWQAAALPLSLLCWMTPLRLLTVIFHAPLNATGHARVVAHLSAVNLSVYVGVIYFVLDLGLLGLVLLSAIALTIGSLLNLVVAQKKLAISPMDLLRTTYRPLAACVVMVIAIAGANTLTYGHPAPIALAVGVLTGGAAYLGALSILMGARVREIVRMAVGR